LATAAFIVFPVGLNSSTQHRHKCAPCKENVTKEKLRE
jgi:hypothetical protein